MTIIKITRKWYIVILLKPLQIRFDKINGFVRTYDGTRYLTLFGSRKL